MKYILIIGEHSYIGNSYQKWLEQYPENYQIDVVSSRNKAWKQIDFGKYDSVLHTAGIAHVEAKSDMEQLYYKVNRDLTIACCQKAKADGARQFTFLSSIIVYGESKSLDPVIITKDTKPVPNGFYGQSKLEAEEGILPLENENFKVAVIRPPMVYGKGSKGNYPKLAKLACTIPFFPGLENKRSMVHIDNLCECLRLIMDKGEGGIFYPQNKEYVETRELVMQIARVHGKRMYLLNIFNPFICILAKKIKLINKVFGTCVYDKTMSDCFEGNYQVLNFKESIQKTEWR
ncbi:MAG: NAD-dependent epimerase/dehydratase family protein [Lachnospiraceae bacterium]|nr:NAD-dependent epimerase/dehydratase family protein [Lachnospiraceae bacterium]